jgi:hypothetical protein
MEKDQTLERLTRVYQNAIKNDWRAVQSTVEQGIAMRAVNEHQRAKIEEKLKIARSILAGENGEHIRMSGIDEA